MEEKAPRQRSRTVLAVFKTKLRRHRSSSDSHVGSLPAVAKCATLPARVGSSKRENSKPKTLYWMGDVVDALESDGLGSVDTATVTRNISEESVDSGFEQPPKLVGDCESPPSHSKALELIPQVEPNLYEASGGQMYASEAVERAFGPMKDVGRWYNSKVRRRHQRLPPDEEAPAFDEANEDERLTSRPLPPIPLEGRARSRSTRERSEAESLIYENETQAVYEHVEHRLLGTNCLILGLRDLACNGWYWGPITRTEAEERLAGMEDGMFLVRDSSDDRYLLSLSFRSQSKTLHTRIEYSNGFFSFYSFPDAESEGYQSVLALIERSMDHSKNGVFCYSRAKALGSPAVPVRLLKPLSRFSQVRSLQHYCRFVIRQSIRFDRIRNLPLPRHVHGFLELSKY